MTHKKIITERDLVDYIARLIASVFFNGSKPGIHYHMTKELYINTTLQGWKHTAQGIVNRVRAFDKEQKEKR